MAEGTTKSFRVVCLAKRGNGRRVVHLRASSWGRALELFWNSRLARDFYPDQRIPQWGEVDPPEPVAEPVSTQQTVTPPLVEFD